MDWMGNVSEAVSKAMESLSKELYAYLEEARGETSKAEEKKEKPREKSLMEKFLGDFYTPKSKQPAVKRQSRKELREDAIKDEKAKAAALGHAKALSWVHYKNFKKAHRMLAW